MTFFTGFEKRAVSMLEENTDPNVELKDPYGAAMRSSVPWMVGGPAVGAAVGALAKKPGFGALVGTGFGAAAGLYAGHKAKEEARRENIGNAVRSLVSMPDLHPGEYALKHPEGKTKRYFGHDDIVARVARG